MFQGHVVFWFDGNNPRVACHTAAGETFVWRNGSRFEVLRAIGNEAANLESGFTWNDADATNQVVRSCWPEGVHNSEVCQCHACRERRDRDTEMQSELAKAKVKILDLVKRYFRKG